MKAVLNKVCLRFWIANRIFTFFFLLEMIQISETVSVYRQQSYLSVALPSSVAKIAIPGNKV